MDDKKLKRRFVALYMLCAVSSASVLAICVQEGGLALDKIPLWQGKKEVRLRELLTIGGNDLAQPDSVIGGINDIAFDNDNNIYILDFVNYRVSKFNSEGKFVAHYGKGKGQGPGELQFPTGVCADQKGNIYIADFRQKMIHVYDQSNAVIKAIRTKSNIGPIFGMAISTDQDLYAGVDLAFSSWNSGLFQIFSLPSGTFIGSLAECDWFISNRNVMSGNNCIALDESRGLIIVSHANPYKIDIFSKKRRLIRSLKMKNEKYETYILDRSKNRIMAGTTVNLAYLPRGIIINVIRYLEMSPEGMSTARQFDFIGINGQYLLAVPDTKFGIKGAYTLVFKADSDGNLWVSYDDPYPHLKKIAIDFLDK